MICMGGERRRTLEQNPHLLLLCGLCDRLELSVAPLIKRLHGRATRRPHPPDTPRGVLHSPGPSGGVNDGVRSKRPVARGVKA